MTLDSEKILSKGITFMQEVVALQVRQASPYVANLRPCSWVSDPFMLGGSGWGYADMSFARILNPPN